LQRQNQKKEDQINSLNRKVEGLNSTISSLEEKIQKNSIDDDEKKELRSNLKDSDNKVSDLNLKIAMMSNQLEEEKKANRAVLERLEKDNDKLQKQILILKGEQIEDKTNENKAGNEGLDQKVEDTENREKAEDNLNSQKKEEEATPIAEGNSTENNDSINNNKNLKETGPIGPTEKELFLENQNKILSNQISSLTNDKEDLESKIHKMKETMQEIKTKLEIEITQKVENRNKIIQDMKKEQKEQAQREETLSAKLSKAIKEKLEYEELIIKQDFKMNDLGGKINQIEVLLRNKNTELKNNEAQANSLIKIIEEQKRQILVFKDDRKNISNLENEIVYLKNFNESLKDDSVAKDEIIRELKQRLIKKSRVLEKEGINHNSSGYKNLLVHGQGQGHGGNNKEYEYVSSGKVYLPKIGSGSNSNNSNSDGVLNSEDVEAEGSSQIKQAENMSNINHVNQMNHISQESKAYEEYLKIENEEKNKNEENFSKINSLMKQVLEE